jgi:hypothetical protein
MVVETTPNAATVEQPATINLTGKPYWPNNPASSAVLFVCADEVVAPPSGAGATHLFSVAFLFNSAG